MLRPPTILSEIREPTFHCSIGSSPASATSCKIAEMCEANCASVQEAVVSTNTESTRYAFLRPTTRRAHRFRLFFAARDKAHGVCFCCDDHDHREQHGARSVSWTYDVQIAKAECGHRLVVHRHGGRRVFEHREQVQVTVLIKALSTC